MRLVSRPLLFVTCMAVACGERGSRSTPATRDVAAAENQRKPPGQAEIGVYCLPSLDRLKTGDAPNCSYLVRWSGEPPLYRDDPYYHAPMTLVSSDSSVLGPQFPPATRVFADSSTPPQTNATFGAPLYAHKPGRATLTARVRDKIVTLPVVVVPPPNLVVRWEPASETTLAVGQSIRVRPVVRDSLGGIVDEPLSVGSVVWNLNAVRLDTAPDRRTYVLTAKAPGRLELLASIYGRASRFVLTVKDSATRKFP